MNLITCAADSHVPRAKNTIRFVKRRDSGLSSLKHRLRNTQRSSQLNGFTLFINSFRRKSGVHPVFSLRQILFGKTFKTPLCKIGEPVMAYDVKASNKTLHPRAFYTLYIGPNDSGTGHSVFKLSIKHLLTRPKCKPMPAVVIMIIINRYMTRRP